MKILLAEDDKELAYTLKSVLQDELFVVDVAHDGEDALFLSKINRYDLGVFDNLMPKKTGKELCSELRLHGINFPILILSVLGKPTTKAELLDAGADDYMTKPYSVSELLSRIRALLRRPPKIKNEIYEFADIKMDVNKNTVYRQDKRINLTRKEFLLLQLFLKHEREVLSRGYILEYVWDKNADPFSNTVETHIFNLRKKLNKDVEKNIIHTIQGRGYKIDISP